MSQEITANTPSIVVTGSSVNDSIAPGTPKAATVGTGTLGYSTPKQNCLKNKALEQLRRDEITRSPQLQLPSTPMMKRLGFGAGMYLLERSPRPSGIRSPWAVKKTSKRLKVDDDSEEFSAARLEYEAETLKRLSHPNIIGFRAFGKTAPGAAFLATEKAQKSLSDLIEDHFDGLKIFPNCEDNDPFPSRVVEKVALDIAKALEYLHDQVKMVHGDLKSTNVLVFGDFEIAKLCDFGVSRKLDSKGYVEGGYVGTKIWNAKEVAEYKRGQTSQPITYKAEIYPLGLVIHEMMTLRPPHLSDAEQSMLGTESSVIGTSDELADISFDEVAFDEALAKHIGTRPPLPDIEFDPSYTNVLSVFFCCTDEDPTKRPDAKDIVASLTETDKSS